MGMESEGEKWVEIVGMDDKWQSLGTVIKMQIIPC